MWDFHKYRDIPHCGIYDLKGCSGRLGCVPCTAYRSWTKNMPIESPKTYAKIKRMLNMVDLDNFSNDEK